MTVEDVRAQRARDASALRDAMRDAAVSTTTTTTDGDADAPSAPSEVDTATTTTTTTTTTATAVVREDAVVSVAPDDATPGDADAAVSTTETAAEERRPDFGRRRAIENPGRRHCRQGKTRQILGFRNPQHQR